MGEGGVKGERERGNEKGGRKEEARESRWWRRMGKGPRHSAATLEFFRDEEHGLRR